MTNPLITTDEVRAADLLATIEEAEYRSIQVVYKLNGKGDATFYCSGPDWPQTEAGRMARYAAEIERLKGEIERLQAHILEQGSRPVTVEEALKITTTVPNPLACPHCPDRAPFKRANAKAAHMRIVHKEMP